MVKRTIIFLILIISVYACIEKENQVPKVNTDIVVLGNNMSAVFAAIEAANLGVDVFFVRGKYNVDSLGAELFSYYSDSSHYNITQFKQELINQANIFIHSYSDIDTVLPDKEILQVELLKFVEEILSNKRNIKILNNFYLKDAIFENNKLSSLELHETQTDSIINLCGSLFIDASYKNTIYSFFYKKKQNNKKDTLQPIISNNKLSDKIIYTDSLYLDSEFKQSILFYSNDDSLGSDSTKTSSCKNDFILPYHDLVSDSISNLFSLDYLCESKNNHNNALLKKSQVIGLVAAGCVIKSTLPTQLNIRKVQEVLLKKGHCLMPISDIEKIDENFFIFQQVFLSGFMKCKLVENDEYYKYYFYPDSIHSIDNFMKALSIAAGNEQMDTAFTWNFDKKEAVTRYEAIEMIWRQLGSPDADNKMPFYKDIDREHHLFEAIQYFSERGWLEGFVTDNFNGDVPLLRKEMALLLNSAFSPFAKGLYVRR